jgi:hypothetical protein
MVAWRWRAAPEWIGDAVDRRYDGFARSLVADACLAAERHTWGDEDGAARLEWLRAELVAVAYCCGDEAAAEARLAVEVIDAALAVEHREALAS